MASRSLCTAAKHLVILSSFAFLLFAPQSQAQSGPQQPLISYALDDIPIQSFWRGSTITWQLQQPGLQGPYTIVSDPEAHGTLSIDRTTGLFKFIAADGDLGNIHITVSAQSHDGGGVSKQFVISVLDGLPPEYELVSKARPLPADDSVQYISVTESDDPIHKPFNTQSDQKLVNATVSGKKIIFDSKADANGLVGRFATGQRTDIETLDIYAETLIIRSPLIFHQTNVRIFAKELRFEDQPGQDFARIVTTPLSWLTTPAVHTDGANGLDAGSISVRIQSFFSSTGNAKRFVLDGGDGQAGGPGQQGPDGAKVACLGDKIVNDTCVVHVHTYAGPTTFPGAFKDNIPSGDGSDSIPGGIPGNPGNGGAFSSSFAGIDQFVENKPGNPGRKANDVPGGAVGVPVHALWLENMNHQPGPRPPFGLPGCLPQRPPFSCRVEHQYDYHSGKGAIAPSARVMIGQKGSIATTVNADSWLTPFALRAILNHAEDAYLGGNLDYTAGIIDQYRPLVDRIVSQDSQSLGNGALDEQETSRYHLFTAISLEMVSTRTRIANNLDYFGHPAGWVPELSFDASLMSYSNEINAAIPILYLAYYVDQSSADHDRHIASLQESLGRLQGDISDATNKYNSAQAAIPELSTSAANLTQDINLFKEKVEIRRGELLAQAQQIVDDRHSVPFWKQALNTLSAAAQVFPIGQPVVGSVGKGLNIIANVDQNTPLDTLKEAGSLAGDFSQANIKLSVANYHAEIAQLDPSKAQSAKDYVKSLAPYAQKLATAYKAVDDSLTTRQAPASEINDELAQLEASDNHFNDLVDNLNQLNTEEQVFAQKIADATKETASLESSISSDWQAIDSVNREVSTATSQNDQEAVQQIDLFARRTRDRLLEYQYYMAKAYEYRMLKPYNGDFNLNKLMTRIATMLDPSAPHTSAYQQISQADFDTLKGIYEESVQEIIFKAFQDFQTNPPPQHRTYPVTLSQSELAELNDRSSVTLDMSRVVPHFDFDENRRINDIDVFEIQATNSDGSNAQSPILITFDHWGTSTFRSNGHSFIFEHRRTSNDRPFEWGGLYNPNSPHNWSKQSVSPTYVETLQTLFSLSSQHEHEEVLNLFAHPGLDSNITITRQAGETEKIAALKFNVDYDFDRGTLLEYPLVILSTGAKPLFSITPSDISGRSTARGTFTRMYVPGAQVTVTAPSNFGNLRFKAWHDGANVIASPKLEITMDGAKTVTAEYGAN